MKGLVIYFVDMLEQDISFYSAHNFFQVIQK